MKKIVFFIIFLCLLIIGFFLLKDMKKKEPFDIMNMGKKVSKGFLINDKGYVLSSDFISSSSDRTQLLLRNSYGSYQNIKIVKRYPNKDILILKIEDYLGSIDYFKFQSQINSQNKDISVSLKNKQLCGTPVLNYVGYVVGINICRNNDINDLMIGRTTNRNLWMVSVDELMKILDSNDIEYVLSTDDIGKINRSSFCSNCNFSFNLNVNLTISFIIIMLFLLYRKSFNRSKQIILKSKNQKYPTIYIKKNKEITVGRAKRNDFVINHKWVSSEHIKIQYREDKIYVKDLKSTNKTYIDAKELISYAYYPLEKYQKLILGSEEVVYEREN